MNEIQVRTRNVYRVLGTNYFSLWSACYRLAKHQLMLEWFEWEDGLEGNSIHWRRDADNQCIAHYSLYQEMTGVEYFEDITSDEQMVDARNRKRLAFNHKKWVAMKKARARELLSKFKKSSVSPEVMR